MPSQPAWFERLDEIFTLLWGFDTGYLDRLAVGRLFGVRQRRACVVEYITTAAGTRSTPPSPAPPRSQSGCLWPQRSDLASGAHFRAHSMCFSVSRIDAGSSPPVTKHLHFGLKSSLYSVHRALHLQFGQRCSRGKRGDAPLCGIAGNKLLAANVLDHTAHSSGEDSQNWL